MEYACRDLGNVMIFLFTQNPNSLTGFKVPIFRPHVETYPSRSSPPSYLKSSPKTVNFLPELRFWDKKTKMSVVLIPKNDKLKLECPIEIARLSVRLTQTEKRSDLIDDFRDIELAEADKPDETAQKLNQVMSALVSGCLLSPFVGIDTMKGEKKQKMVAQKFSIRFQTNSSEIQAPKSGRKNMKRTSEENDGIIVINPETEGFEDTILRKIRNKKGRNELKSGDLNEELDDLNDCTQQSRDGSENDSNQPFMGKTHSLHWKVESVDSMADIHLQIHDNLNSICSFIKKTHLDEKSTQPRRRNRFLSEDTTHEINAIKRRNFRNNSFVNLQNFPVKNKVEIPFKILKDEIVSKCLNKKNGAKAILLKEDFSRVQLTTREEKCGGGNFTESKWSLTSKRSLKDQIKMEEPDLESQEQSLKKMFNLAKYLKREIRKEMRVTKKRMRYSEQSIKAKRSEKISSNYFSEQPDQGPGENFFSIKTKNSKETSSKKSAQRSTNQPFGFEIDEEDPPTNKRTLNTLIKFKRPL